MGGYVPRGSIDSVGPPPGAFNATTVPPLNPDPRLMLAFSGGLITTLEQANEIKAAWLAKHAEPVEPIILASDYGYNCWPTYQRERPRWGYWLRLARYVLTHPYTRTRVGC